MTVSINGTSGIVFNDASTQNTAATGFGFKNRILNGQMQIDQRNAGASVTPTTSTYTLDRFRVLATQSSKFSVQQNAGSVTPPAGFKNYLGITSLSAYSVTTGDNFSIQQKIEGYNVADLDYGSASSATTTLSFWVRSSLTGTFGGVFGNEAANRCYIFSYTINSANTWEQKTITVTGDTTGTWLTTNGNGLDVRFNFGSGSDKLSTAGSWGSTFYNSVTGQTSVVGTNGATFYITGVQLEKGSTATSFDYRPYGTELALCQRYYEKSYDTTVAPGTISGAGTRSCSNAAAFVAGITTRNFIINNSFAVAKRTIPTTVTFYDPNILNASGKISAYSAGTQYTVSSLSGLGVSSLGNFITTGTAPSQTEASAFHFTVEAEL